MYVNGSSFRAIERVKKVHHTTVIYWVKQVGSHLPENPETTEIPEITEIDELETFVGSKKQNLDMECSQSKDFGDFNMGFRR
jgi:hypothetical protein